MATSHVKYLGNLRTEATHLQSGNTMITDAPTDNHGKGEAFSPTDTLATSLATCIITTIAIKVAKRNWDVEGMEAEVTKIMANDPRRVAEVIVKVKMPANNYTEEQKETITDIALNCPVAKSLSAELIQTIVMEWP